MTSYVQHVSRAIGTWEKEEAPFFLCKKLIILMIFRRLKNVNNKTGLAGNVNTWSGLTNSSDREKVVHFFCPVFLNARMNPR